MIDCGRVAEVMTAYLDKSLNESDVLAIEEHLDKCSDCFGHYEFDLVVKKLIRKIGKTETLSEDSKSRIFKQLDDLGE